jgi:hypothetical protein
LEYSFGALFYFSSHTTIEYINTERPLEIYSLLLHEMREELGWGKPAAVD